MSQMKCQGSENTHTHTPHTHKTNISGQLDCLKNLILKSYMVGARKIIKRDTRLSTSSSRPVACTCRYHWLYGLHDHINLPKHIYKLVTTLIIITVAKVVGLLFLTFKIKNHYSQRSCKHLWGCMGVWMWLCVGVWVGWLECRCGGVRVWGCVCVCDESRGTMLLGNIQELVLVIKISVSGFPWNSLIFLSCKAWFQTTDFCHQLC